jgi:Uncharacterized protein, homolog of phage Mu protein gp30
MGRREDEDRLTGVVGRALSRWLGRVRDKVMEPWRRFGIQPDPNGIYQERGSWDAEVDTIMTVIGQISRNAWSEAVDVPPVSRHSFVMAQLAMTQNFLVRIPDEVYELVFAEITDAVNGGEDVAGVARRVDQVLDYGGGERWPGRARTIAQTETTRAYGAGTLAGGMEQSRITGRLLRKRWDTEQDERVRVSHREVDGDIVDLGMPFYVDGVPLMFPGDPMGPPETVINCRCDLTIVNEGRR